MTTLMVATLLRPYSARIGVRDDLELLNGVDRGPDHLRGQLLKRFSEIELLSMPSRMQLFCKDRTPCTLNPPVRPVLVLPPWSV